MTENGKRLVVKLGIEASGMLLAERQRLLDEHGIRVGTSAVVEKILREVIMARERIEFLEHDADDR